MPEQQIVGDGELGENLAAFGHLHDAARDQPVDRQAGDVLALEADAPAGERHDAGDAVERRGLAGAVRAEQADHLAGRRR